MYVYILQCRDGSYYTGYTPDLYRRMKAHWAGTASKYTHSHPVQRLAAVWQCPDATAARRLEYAIKKKLSRAKKELLIASPEDVGQFLPALANIPFVPLSVIGNEGEILQ